ncbi:hypothetical protein DFH08DRAFT_1000177 [Mycena albidolilacea]|uniref:Uncharacterized protein n=1 Tax=Mycena albidolilacea TaxID=1033008 RepID=A0AAD7A2U0_9AGAR|nr:hypothetical protein DFH08DRAFT_1000177 [Mycena albidolilacea]
MATRRSSVIRPRRAGTAAVALTVRPCFSCAACFPSPFTPLLPPMSFRPSIEKINKVDDPHGTPPLLFSNHILQDSDDPDLPTAFHCADWSNLEHPLTTSTAAGLSHPASQSNIVLPSVMQMRPPTNTANQMADLFQHPAVPPAGIVPDARGEERGTAISDGQLDVGKGPGKAPSHFSLPHVADVCKPPAPSDTALGKRRQWEYATDPPAQTHVQFLWASQHTVFRILHFGTECDSLHPLFPGQAPMSSKIQSHPAERALVHDLSGHTSYSPAVVNSSMSNAAHTLQSTSNIHQHLSVQSSGIDPTLTYLPVSVGPIQLKLQDSPAAEPGSPGLSPSALQFQSTYIIEGLGIQLSYVPWVGRCWRSTPAPLPVNCRKKPVAALQIQPKNYRKNLKHPEACKKQFRVTERHGEVERSMAEWPKDPNGRKTRTGIDAPGAGYRAIFALAFASISLSS